MSDELSRGQIQSQSGLQASHHEVTAQTLYNALFYVQLSDALLQHQFGRSEVRKLTALHARPGTC